MYYLRMIDSYPLKSKFSATTLDGIEIFYWPFNSSEKDTEKLWIKQWLRSPELPTVSDLQEVFLRIAQSVSGVQVFDRD